MDGKFHQKQVPLSLPLAKKTFGKKTNKKPLKTVTFSPSCGRGAEFQLEQGRKDRQMKHEEKATI